MFIIKCIIFIVFFYYLYNIFKYFKNITINDRKRNDYESTGKNLDILDGEFEDLD